MMFIESKDLEKYNFVEWDKNKKGNIIVRKGNGGELCSFPRNILRVHSDAHCVNDLIRH